MNNKFYYEHIGHMQFSTLTLKSLEIINNLVLGKTGKFVSWEQAQTMIEQSGFSIKQAAGELDRFCYGFECLDRYNVNGIKEIMLTNIGRSFIDNLLIESPYQSNQFAFLMRPARKKRSWNVIIQESTFFNPEIYKIIKQFNFRKGPARDFLKCINIDDFIDFLNLIFTSLSPTEQKQPTSLAECIKKVETHGKYWASVGGKYSWFVFSQRFDLPFSIDDWICYKNLINELIRPTEWGGGKDVSYGRTLELLNGKENFSKFRSNGIIRPMWRTKDITDALFRLTAPGYLMWERKTKGFIFEFCIRRFLNNEFELSLCEASDSIINQNVMKKQSLPSLVCRENKEELINMVRNLVDGKQLF